MSTEAAKRNTFLWRYIPDWILTALATGGLLRNIYNGYDMQDTLSFSLPLICLFAAGILLILFWLADETRRLRIGLIVGAGIVAAAVVIMQIRHPFVDEQNSSSMIFWILLCMVSVGAFWLTRTRTGCILYLAAGNLIIAAEVFLEFGLIGPGYLLFLLAAAGLTLYRFYSRSIQDLTDWEETAGKLRRQTGRYLVQIGAVLGVAAGIAALCFFLIIVPLNPPTQDLVLIQKLKSMTVIQKVGVTSILSQIDYDLESDEETNTQRTTGQTDEEGDKDREETAAQADSAQEEAQDETAQAVDAQEKSTDASQQQEANAIKYDRTRVGWVIILAACIAGWIVLHRLWILKRRRWYAKICRMDRRDGVITLYQYFLKALSVVHVEKQEHLTLREFAKAGRKYTDPFIYGDVNFRDLTDVYDRTRYGGAPVTEAEWRLFDGAYREFHANVRDELGFWRYIPVFFRI